MRGAGKFLPALFSLLATFLSACADGRSQADDIAAQGGFTRQMLQTGSFPLLSFSRLPRPGNPALTIYIEGDGFAFVTASQIARDPTPHRQDVLGMASRHPGNVAYLARPCQYLSAAELRNCHPAFWTNSRFAPEVVDATTRAIDILKKQAGATQIILVGYSGGGVVAALVAEQRNDVAGLVTVASPLDTDAWIRLGGLSPLLGSLEPVDHLDRLTGVPQLHLTGENDDVVSSRIVSAFLARFPANQRPPMSVVHGYDHSCCWVQAWPHIVISNLTATNAQLTAFFQ